MGEYRSVEPMARVRFSPVALFTKDTKKGSITTNRMSGFPSDERGYPSVTISNLNNLNNDNDINGGLNMDRVKLTGSVHCSSKE